MRVSVRDLLSQKPDGAGYDDIGRVLFPAGSVDNDFSRTFIDRLLAGDPRVERSADGTWGLTEGHLFSIPIAEVPFVIVDLEATGDHSPGASTGVTEIGAVKMIGGKDEGRFEQLVNPGSRIPPYVEKLTGITNEMVRDAPPIEDVIEGFYDFAQGSVVVAHNAAFDFGVLDQAVWRVLGRPLACPALCTIDLVRYAYPDLERTSLEWLAEHFEIEQPTRHRAVADAEMTGKVLYRALGELEKRGVRTLDELCDKDGAPLATARLGVYLPQSRLESLPQGPGVYRLIDEQGATLFVARAGDVREKLVQMYLNADRLGKRQLEMIDRTREIDATATGSYLETVLEEAAWIRRFDPSYNRGGKHVPKTFFVKLAAEADPPRIMAASRVGADGARYIGPLKNRAFAEQAASVLSGLFGVELGQPEVGSRAHAAHSLSANRPEAPAGHDPDAARRLAALLEDGPDAVIAAAKQAADSRSDGRKSLGALRRLARLHESHDWLVDRHTYAAVLPSVRAAGCVVVVRQGRLAGVVHPDSAADLEGVRALLIGVESRRTTRGERAERADAASILANWVRSLPRPDRAVVVRYDLDAGEAGVESVLNAVAKALR